MQGSSSQAFIEEIRLEIADIRQDLRVIQTEFGILDEKVQKQTALPSYKQGSSVGDSAANRLEKRLSDLDLLVQKMAAGLRNVHASNQQALSRLQNLEQEITSHEKRLDEVVKLKGTLSSISKAIGQSSPAGNLRTHRVKAGDSLEKIARNYRVSVASVKDLNGLKNDKIVVGQELKVPDEAS
ncbi:MAG: LysM peptidoglycan-binding domain-containing protein [Chlamydiales bacterium]|nr:LysM peptidoglycan-binding domain-containing protein [Chlamydiales bacterium]